MLDWDDLRYFLAVQRHGNLSAAARELGVAQSTVGRRLNSLESTLGVRLLNRTPDGYHLTSAGVEVRERALVLEAQTRALEHLVGGRDIHLAGLVRVTCAESMAAFVLAPSFQSLQREHGDIVVELIPDPRELSLARREADIAVRLTSPIQHDTIIRRIGSMAYGLYASPDYLDRVGVPKIEAGGVGHEIIRQLNDVENAPQFNWLENIATRAKIVFQTSSHEAAVSATLAGGGLACLARFRADIEQGLVRLDPPLSPPSAGIWLAIHKDNRDTARIRAVMDHMAQRVRAMRDLLSPDGNSTADNPTDDDLEFETSSIEFGSEGQ